METGASGRGLAQVQHRRSGTGGEEAGPRKKGGLVGARRDWNWNRGSLPPPSSSEVAEGAAGMAPLDGGCGGAGMGGLAD